MPYVGPGPRGHEETAPGRRSAVVMRPVMLRWQRRQEAHRLALADAEALSAIMAPRPTARPASTTRHCPTGQRTRSSSRSTGGARSLWRMTGKRVGIDTRTRTLKRRDERHQRPLGRRGGCFVWRNEERMSYSAG